MTDQEIRAKSLEIAVLMLGVKHQRLEIEIIRCYHHASEIAAYIREGTVPETKASKSDS